MEPPCYEFDEFNRMTRESVHAEQPPERNAGL